MNILNKDRYNDAMYYFLGTLRKMVWFGAIVYGPNVDRFLDKKYGGDKNA